MAGSRNVPITARAVSFPWACFGKAREYIRAQLASNSTVARVTSAAFSRPRIP